MHSSRLAALLLLWFPSDSKSAPLSLRDIVRCKAPTTPINIGPWEDMQARKFLLSDPWFSVIIQVQERLTAQLNPSHEQSTLKLLISGFNKKLPKKSEGRIFWKRNLFNLSIQLQIEGVNEKKLHESEDGVLFTLQRQCILYRTEDFISHWPRKIL